MAAWKDILHKLGYEAEQQFESLAQKFNERIGSDRTYYIQPYRWFGTQKGLVVRGRVLGDNGLRESQDQDGTWNNLLSSYRRFNSKELPYAKLRLRYGDAVTEVEADDEGYFEAILASENGAPLQAGWRNVAVQLIEPADDEIAMAEVMVVGNSAEYGIISDIDDTILKTFATNLIKVAKLTFLNSARMRLPFPGVAAFYNALVGGTTGDANNPIFYVSSSPWNLYDLLIDFMRIHDIPAGPLMLRDLGIDENKFITSGHGDHKTAQIARVLNAYPDLPFILIGDSGQHDPEIYRDVVKAFPNRIKAAYIRDVTQETREMEIRTIVDLLQVDNVPMVLTENSFLAAEHAAASGFIAPHTLEPIRVATLGDEEDPDAIEQLL